MPNYEELHAKPDVASMKSMGYHRISNKYRMASRIDREDWLEHLAEHMRRSVAELYTQGTNEVSPHWADYYRRVLSKDVIGDIPIAMFSQLPGS